MEGARADRSCRDHWGGGNLRGRQGTHPSCNTSSEKRARLHRAPNAHGSALSLLSLLLLNSPTTRWTVESLHTIKTPVNMNSIKFTRLRGREPCARVEETIGLQCNDSQQILRTRGSQTKLLRLNGVAKNAWQRSDRFHARRRAPPLNSSHQKFVNAQLTQISLFFFPPQSPSSPSWR